MGLLPPEIANRKTKALMGYQHYVEAQELLRGLASGCNRLGGRKTRLGGVDGLG